MFIRSSRSHYQVLSRETGELFELGRGAMGITSKAFDVDLRYPSPLRLSAPTFGAMNPRACDSYRKLAPPQERGNRMLPRCFISEKAAKIISTPWSLLREKPSTASLNAKRDSRPSWRLSFPADCGRSGGCPQAEPGTSRHQAEQAHSEF